MPWAETTPMEEITRFVMLAQSGRFTVTDLCGQCSVFAGKTGGKHLTRYAESGWAGLEPRSNRPNDSPSARMKR